MSTPPRERAVPVASARCLCFFRTLLDHLGSPLPEPAARGYEASRLLNEIAAVADVITDLYVTSDPCFPSGFSSSTNVGRGL